MPEETIAQKEGSENPPHGPESNPPPAATRPTRSQRKKILVPAVLGVIGAAVIVVGLWTYPRRPEMSAPAVPTVLIDGSSPFVDNHMELYEYTVSQPRPGVAHVQVSVVLFGPPHTPGGDTTSVPRGASATIQLYAGTRMLDCSPGCHLEPAAGVAYPRFQRPGLLPPTATADFYVRAPSYQVAANGATAAVGFPELKSSGTRPAELDLQYRNFPSAASYDWSASPGESISGPLSLNWSETALPRNSLGLVSGGTTAQVATGVNHTAQQRDSNFTLAAGVLFGIGGAALVAAVQESLHAND